jgi:hypothetical protein
MSDPLFPLDLKFLPDWLKEAPQSNPYAGHSGDAGFRDRGARAEGGQRHAGRGRDQAGQGPRQARQEDRRPGGPRPPGREGQRAPRMSGGNGPKRGPRDDHRQRQHSNGPDQRGPRPPGDRLPCQVRIEFLPEPNAAALIARQIRQGAKAYPLFGTAKMFLEKPERHIARITSLDSAHPLHQLGDGVIGFDSALLERDAFRSLWKNYYKEEVLAVDPPKGTFTSVAKCRSTGQLLGPKNHHAYQVAVRKLYEERFSRSMSFLDFQRDEIELLTSEQAVEDWKTEASRTVVYQTLDETEPKQFKSIAEAELDFRKNHLPELMKTGLVLQCGGKAVREMHERGLTSAAREAFDKETTYPAGIVNGLRRFLNEEGLHIFKHRKRLLYVTPIWPKRADSTQGFAEGPATLLKLIEESPRISKRDLAVKILGLPATLPPAESPEEEASRLEARKTQIASDLHYLIHAGYVLEFADGRLDLPLSPKQQAAVESAKEDAAGEESTEEPSAHGTVATEVEEHASGESDLVETHQPSPADSAEQIEPESGSQESPDASA